MHVLEGTFRLSDQRQVMSKCKIYIKLRDINDIFLMCVDKLLVQSSSLSSDTWSRDCPVYLSSAHAGFRPFNRTGN
jgi:hypothetical protein